MKKEGGDNNFIMIIRVNKQNMLSRLTTAILMFLMLSRRCRSGALRDCAGVVTVHDRNS